MLSELVSLGRCLQAEDRMPPTCYRFMSKQSPIRYVIHIQPDGSAHVEEARITNLPRPARQRSGQVAVAKEFAEQKNLKPYFLADEARYALGRADRGMHEETAMWHRAFRELLERAADAARADAPDRTDADGDGSRGIEQELRLILGYLVARTEKLDADAGKISARDVVTFSCAAGPLLIERKWIRRFWARHVRDEFASQHEGTCGVCGSRERLLQTLPTEVVVAGQKCAVVSFNKGAFRSYGKEQTTNAPLCFDCGELAAQSLNYLLRDPTRHCTLVNGKSKGRTMNPLRVQTAVFWLARDEAVSVEGEVVDVGTLLSEPIIARPNEPVRPRLSQLDAFLKMPWSGCATALGVANAFHLAILSANKGRLTVRDWIAADVDRVRRCLGTFADAVRLVNPAGGAVQMVGIPELIDSCRAQEGDDANLVRGLLRTAYVGGKPPDGLLPPALRQLHIPRNSRESWTSYNARRARLMSVVKLVLTYGKEDAQSMERLDRERNAAAYLSGRVFASLEEAQMRHALPGHLNSTLVDRFYGSVSTAPCAYLPGLIRLAQGAHLPKIRRERRGFARLDCLFQDLFSKLDEAGGIPRRLTIQGQAEFALGYYHQRAEFASERQPASAPSTPITEGEPQ